MWREVIKHLAGGTEFDEAISIVRTSSVHIKDAVSGDEENVAG